VCAACSAAETTNEDDDSDSDSDNDRRRLMGGERLSFWALDTSHMLCSA
jgi:hypothetical protein